LIIFGKNKANPIRLGNGAGFLFYKKTVCKIFIGKKNNCVCKLVHGKEGMTKSRMITVS